MRVGILGVVLRYMALHVNGDTVEVNGSLVPPPRANRVSFSFTDQWYESVLPVARVFWLLASDL